jgi:GAF domain-containing protein
MTLLLCDPLLRDPFLCNQLQLLGEALQVDRCFLYVRNPYTRLGRVPFCWTRTSDIPTVYDPDWKPEPVSLPDEDPMFAAALRTEPSIFVEDVSTASADLLNAQFEQENFGHRALIHGHICQDDQLWGVLQPCVFGQPRIWSVEDKATIVTVIDQITAWVVGYVQSHTQTKDLSQE